MLPALARIAELVAAIDAAGLCPPAEPLDLAVVPPKWRFLWAAHNGQSARVSSLFLDFWFMPLSGVDSVANESVPAGFFPLAKDFGGALLAIRVETGEVVELDGDGECVEVASGPEAFLAKVLERLEEEPPERWIERDGRFLPESQRVLEVGDLPDWGVGEIRELADGLVLVRVVSPDPAPFAKSGSRIDFAIDHPSDPDAKGALVSASLSMPNAPEGARSDAAAGVSMSGDRYWISAEGALPRDATLKVEIDRSAPVDGPRPLFEASRGVASVARAEARLALGDPDAAYADAVAVEPVDSALAARAAFTCGKFAEARDHASGLAFGHPVRVRVYADSDPELAITDLTEWIARRPDGVAYAWRAALYEAIGDFASAAADTEEALERLSLVMPEVVPGLRAAQRRRNARRASTRVAAPVLEDSTEEAFVGEAIAVEPASDGTWRATVVITPAEAASGRLVELLFPDGDRGAVRLPRGAGHGLAATVRVGRGDIAVRLELAVRLPKAWRSAGDNPTLEFERWDVLAPVEEWRPVVHICGLDGDLCELAWPQGEELRVVGRGLPKADGSRGDLRVVRR